MVKTLIRSAVERVRTLKHGSSPRNFLLVFNWHQVTPAFNRSSHGRYTWTRLEDFERELDYLKSEFHVLPLPQGIERLEQGRLDGSFASLTFDDGDVSMAEFVLPSLRKRNLPATFFVNSAYLAGKQSYWFPILSHLSSTKTAVAGVGKPADFDEWNAKLRNTTDPMVYKSLRTRVEALAPMVPDLATRVVSAAWLHSLDGDQFCIGAHGHEHERFSMMPAEWQRNDLEENVRQLSGFRAFRPFFAVPFGRAGDWTQETIRVAHEQKLAVVLADGGVNVSAADYYQRIPSDGSRLRPLIERAMMVTR